MENLDIKLKKILENIDLNNKPNLFLHVCCGPCATYVLKYLYNYFNIYIIFYNPNIDTLEEYNKRFVQLEKISYIEKYNLKVLKTNYIHSEYLNYVKGYEKEKEGKKRCEKCMELRIKKSFEIANDCIVNEKLTENQNFITSTLSISPHKNSEMIYNIFKDTEKNYDNIKYLYSDFKKSNGFLKSVELSKEYNLYRQNYCGCEFR